MIFQMKTNIFSKMTLSLIASARRLVFTLKVSNFQKQIILFSILPINGKNNFYPRRLATKIHRRNFVTNSHCLDLDLNGHKTRRKF
jgi:hypothetical protein